MYLAYAVRKLVMVQLGELPVDDMDDYQNRRSRAAGVLLGLQTRQLVRSFFKTLRSQIYKRTQPGALTAPGLEPSCRGKGKNINLLDLFKANKISVSMRYAFSTGNWGTQRGANNQTGVCQILADTNLVSRLSHLRQTTTPINKDGKSAKPRQLPWSQLGVHCTAETPEDKAVGLQHHLAFLTRIRTGCPSELIMRLLYSRDFGVEPIAQCEQMLGRTLVLVNGILCGGVREPQALVERYKQYRRAHAVPIDSSVSLSAEALSIWTDPEACYRPLLRVDRLALLAELCRLYGAYLHLLWAQLLQAGVVEYLDKGEEGNAYVAQSLEQLHEGLQEGPAFTHLELSLALTLFGVSAGTIPFPQHDQSPRLLFQCLEQHEPVRMADGSWRALRDVRVGELVQAFEERSHAPCVAQVLATSRTPPGAKQLLRLHVASVSLLLSTDHLVRTPDGRWAAAGSLSAGDAVLVQAKESREGAPVPVRVERVERADRESRECWLADITTSTGTFVHARTGLCVHNSSMGKQAIAAPPPNVFDRMVTKQHVLNYPQKSLVTTLSSELAGIEEEPSGQVCLVAILAFEGSNIEDAILLNGAALERGLFRTSTVRTAREHETRQGSDEERIGCSDAKLGRRVLNYDTVDPTTGLVRPGRVVQKDDVLVEKFVLEQRGGPAEAARKRARDEELPEEPRVKARSVRSACNFVRHDERAQVLRVCEFWTKDDLKAVAVQSCSQRLPEEGDKFSSRHSQKGVCGRIFRPEDLPFAERDGRVPDLILNPHAIPSRMTIGHLMETALGKVVALEARFGDGTAFRNVSADDINEATLDKCFGRELFRSGLTGERLKNPVFFGLVTYQRLKHRVQTRGAGCGWTGLCWSSVVFGIVLECSKKKFVAKKKACWKERKRLESVCFWRRAARRLVPCCVAIEDCAQPRNVPKPCSPLWPVRHDWCSARSSRYNRSQIFTPAGWPDSASPTWYALHIVRVMLRLDSMGGWEVCVC